MLEFMGKLLFYIDIFRLNWSDSGGFSPKTKIYYIRKKSGETRVKMDFMYNFAGFSKGEVLRFPVVFDGKLRYDNNKKCTQKNGPESEYFQAVSRKRSKKETIKRRKEK